jgi:uncharacterized coiled-coil protein SlyX
MDRRILEFWGNCFLQAAKSQKQLDDFNEWMRLGFKGYEEFNTMFRKAFGLQDRAGGNQDQAQTWSQTVKTFQDSFKELSELMGVVPRQEHLELIRKYEDLKATAASQEETIQHLNALLGSKGAEEDRLSQGMQAIMAKQTEQFQELMKGFNHYLQQTSSGGEEDE